MLFKINFTKKMLTLRPRAVFKAVKALALIDNVNLTFYSGDLLKSIATYESVLKIWAYK